MEVEEEGEAAAVDPSLAYTEEWRADRKRVWVTITRATYAYSRGTRSKKIGVGRMLDIPELLLEHGTDHLALWGTTVSDLIRCTRKKEPQTTTVASMGKIVRVCSRKPHFRNTTGSELDERRHESNERERDTS